LTFVVFDGLFLTAVRQPRCSELRELLDVAQECRARFCTLPAPFTSSLEPAAAVRKLLDVGPSMSLAGSGRAKYFSLLSNLTEKDFERL
jgi:hypothetical protein